MIPVQKVLVRYTVTAGVLEYAVPFALYGTGDVNVYWAAAGDTETQTKLAPGTDYSVTVFRDMTGGKVTLADGKVPAGATLAIESAVPLTQELDLSNTATVDTEATEGQLDRMVQMIQQFSEQAGRAVKVPVTSDKTPEQYMSEFWEAVKNVLAAIVEAGKNIGNSTYVTATGSDRPRTLADRFGDVVNVKDFGAVGDGVTDDTEAIQKALSFAVGKNSMLFFPAGKYSATQNLVNFRIVRKIGTGIIKRGAYMYSITPTTLDTNSFYVSPSGVVANDGLTPETPITIGTAISSMRYLVGASEAGQWKIHMLPGTYTDTGVRISYLPHFAKPLILEGEREVLKVSTEAEYSDDFLYYTDNQCTSVPYEYDPDTWLEAKRAGLWRQRPTVTWDGTSSAEHYALRMSQPNVTPLTLFMQDIIFANWKHLGFEGNSGGIAIDRCVTYSQRCRFYNCGVGEWYRSGQSTHKQNVYRDCGTGIKGQYSHAGTVGDTGGGACLFSGCVIGMHVGRASVMHNDGNHYAGCGYCCETAYLSRNAIIGGVYRDWNSACFTQYCNSEVTNPESATYLGTPDGTKPISLSRDGSFVESGGDGLRHSIVGYTFPASITMVHTGSTDRTILSDNNYGRIAAIPKRTCAIKGTIDSGMIIRVHVNVGLSGTGGATLELANTPGENQSLAALSIPNGAGYSGWAVFEIVVKGANSETGRCAALGRAYIEQSNTVNKTSVSSSLWTTAMVGDTFDFNVLRWYATLGNASDTLSIGGWYTELWR